MSCLENPQPSVMAGPQGVGCLMGAVPQLVASASRHQAKAHTTTDCSRLFVAFVISSVLVQYVLVILAARGRQVPRPGAAPQGRHGHSRHGVGSIAADTAFAESTSL